MKSLSEKRFQEPGHSDSLVPDLLAMITELRAEKAEIDEAIEVLERVRSSKLRGVTDHRRTCRRALRRLSIWSRTTAFLKPI